MTRDEINEEYFNWMLDFVYDRNSYVSYMKLFSYLYSREFQWKIPMDENRSDDGEALRWRFRAETNCDPKLVSLYLDDRECSVLELMIALAIRCETHLMSDPEYGDRTSQWFWNMLINLGFAKMDDEHFDEAEANDILQRFMLRRYDRNGRGGLFVCSDPNVDMRELEIWKQMNLYINDVFYTENERG